VQFFTAIYNKYCAKYKSAIKKILHNYFSLVLFALAAWKEQYEGLAGFQCYLWWISWFAS